MTSRETSTEIEQQAALWAAKADARALSSDEEAELRAWLAGDTRRVGAYAMALAALARVDAAMPDGGGAPADEPGRKGRSRQRV